ncbi:SH3 domain-containing protein [Streptomyces malaysiensis]|uniref:SH3 domain-containing protein n=1 Tax=Streptomyces malaysiensis TaxID=92644 RepID=UPI0033D8D952
MAIEETADTAATDGADTANDTANDTAEATTDAVGIAAGAITYPVAPGYQVNVRSGPGTNYRVVKVLPYNSRVPIRCQRHGQKVSGPYGTSDIWDNIAPGQYVSDAYVKTGSDGFVTVPCG